MKIRIKRLATTLLAAALLVTMSGATAWAAIDTEPVVNRDSDGVNVDLGDAGANYAYDANDGGSYTVNGDVTATNEYEYEPDATAVHVTGGSDVTVNGSISASVGDYSYYSDIHGVDVYSNGTPAGKTTKVTINGDVTSQETALVADAKNGGKILVTVNGDMNGAYYGVALYAANANSEVNYVGTGDIRASYDGVDIGSESDGIVHFQNTGSIYADYIALSNYDDSDQTESARPSIATFEVDGDISTSNGSSNSVVLSSLKTGSVYKLACTGTISGAYGLYFNALDWVTKVEEFPTPDITLWSLETAKDSQLVYTACRYAGSSDPSQQPDYIKKAGELIQQNINYIIRKNANIGGFEVVDASGSSTPEIGSTQICEKDYQTAKVGAHKITIKPQAGYKLLSIRNASDYGDLVDNGDGTYTLEVLDGGHIVLDAVLEKLPDEIKPEVPSKAPGTAKASKSSKASKARTAHKSAPSTASEAANAVITTYDKDGKEAGKLTASTYDEFCAQIAEAIQSAPQDGKIVIATDKYTEIDLSALGSLQSRDDLSLEVRYDTALDDSTQDLLGKDAKSSYASASVPAGSYTKISKLAKAVTDDQIAAGVQEGTKRVAFKELGKKFEAEKISSIY